MKWFKHNSDAYSNLKLQKFRKIFGIEGYGFFWICCELVGQQKQDTEYIIKKEKNWKDWLQINTDLPIEKIDAFLQKMAEINLIDRENLERGHLSIPKMTEYSDDYSKRVDRTLSEQGADSVRTVFGKSRVDKIRLDKSRLDKKRVEVIPLSFEQLRQTNKFDTEDLKILKVLYDLGFKCNKGGETELSKWIDELYKEYVTDHLKEIVKFKEYWEAQTKKIKTHKLAWRNWLNNSIRFKK